MEHPDSLDQKCEQNFVNCFQILKLKGQIEEFLGLTLFQSK